MYIFFSLSWHRNKPNTMSKLEELQKTITDHIGKKKTEYSYYKKFDSITIEMIQCELTFANYISNRKKISICF